MDRPTCISEYLTRFAPELGQRILDSFPPLQGPDDPVSPLLSKLLRRPFASQVVVIQAIARRLAEANSAAVVAECGTGKTLISLASVFVASGGMRYAGPGSIASDREMAERGTLDDPVPQGLRDRRAARLALSQPQWHSGSQASQRPHCPRGLEIQFDRPATS
jgi:hypothetical protein